MADPWQGLQTNSRREYRWVGLRTGRRRADRHGRKSPLSEQAGIYYRLQVRDRRSIIPDGRRSLNDLVDLVGDLFGLKYDEERRRFRILNQSLSIEVEPESATFFVEARERFAGDENKARRSRLEARYGRSGRFRKYVERSVLVGDEVYVIGAGTMKGNKLVIKRSGGLFLITDGSLSDLRRRYALRAALSILTALGLLAWIAHLVLSGAFY